MCVCVCVSFDQKRNKQIVLSFVLNSKLFSVVSKSNGEMVHTKYVYIVHGTQLNEMVGIEYQLNQLGKCKQPNQ